MRGGVTAVVCLILLAAVPLGGAAVGKPTPTASSMTVAASPHTTAAHAVRLTLTLHYEMQCGYAGAGPLVVVFPPAIKLPKRFSAGAVQLAGKPVVATVDGRHVTVTIAPRKGVMCDAIGPGSLALTFTSAAKLANPAQAGSYHFTATHAKRAFVAALAISR